MALTVALVYFGLFRAHRLLGIVATGAVTVLLIWTSPNRWGAGIALHYLSRVYWPDPSDPIPPVV